MTPVLGMLGLGVGVCRTCAACKDSQHADAKLLLATVHEKGHCAPPLISVALVTWQLPYKHVDLAAKLSKTWQDTNIA